MEEDTVHVLIAMRVIVAMVVAMVVVAVLKTENANEIYQEPSKTNGEQFSDAMHFTSGRKPLYRFVDNFDTYNPGNKLA